MDFHKSPKETVLITGGGGYFGFRLGCALNQQGVHVILFDISRPVQTIPEGIQFILGDIRHLSDIENAFQGVDVACVFHIASYEMTHFILGRLYNFQPFLTRTEVYKTGVTHYFSLEKAKKELGYEAQPFDLQEAVEWFKAHGHGRRPGSRDSTCLVRDGLVILLLVTMVLAWLLPSVIPSV